MRLKKLKLAGFKSFVDPTVVLFPSRRVGVVGPNGCGKSNIIDAVRWVMGESSAKTLRGESMSDVIFNGSTSRKPVGQASVELIFDNTEGRLVGEYSQYAEIAIRRVVSRDGQSTYYLNGTRCRRKDVADIFLGTGLGPRSYAIIGQNTISHIIEAKPEDLRLYIEEAAGISKYKDRRRDAQSRMENTRENLLRVNDIREELTKQVIRLERQSIAAGKYTELEALAKKLQAECDVMRWRTWHDLLLEREKIIHENQAEVETHLKQLNVLDTTLQTLKSQHQKATEHHNQKQALYYQSGIESARLKETIAHQKAEHLRLMHELEQINHERKLAHEKLENSQKTLETLSKELEQLKPTMDGLQSAKHASENALATSEKDRLTWQKNWDQFNQAASESAQKAKISQTRIEHTQEAIQTAEKRLLHWQETLNTLEKTEPLTEALTELQNNEKRFKEELDTLKQSLDECVKAWAFHREANEEKRRNADAEKKQLQQLQGELTSLEALQNTALGKKDETVKTWLNQQSFSNEPRLAQQIEVADGWEKAVERILGHLLQGICVQNLEDLGNLDALTQSLIKGECALIDTSWTNSEASLSTTTATKILDKIQHANDAVKMLLKDIYIAENLEEAKKLQCLIPDNASIITREGAWLGKGWLQWIQGKQANDGILQRENTIKTLVKQIKKQEKIWTDLNLAYEEGCAAASQYELKRSELTEKIQKTNQQWVDAGAKIHVAQNKIDQLSVRQKQLEKDYNEQKNLIQQLQQQKETIEKERLIFSESIQKNDQLRKQWLEDKEKLSQQHEQLRTAAQKERENWHAAEIKLMSLQTQKNGIQQNIARDREHIAQLDKRYHESTASLQKENSPLTDLQPQWEKVSKQHADEEILLKEAAQNVEKLNQELNHTEKDRAALEKASREKQTQLEEQRLEAQTLKVKCENIEETLTHLNIQLSSILEHLPENALMENWEKELQTVHNKIKNLGPINLAALDEFKTESERKKVLDEQYDDLTKALETLEDAIEQIDGETRSRFEETYNQINSSFQILFPRLFGGGQAYMELIGNDCLDAGIGIMAQPPGKRNSSIHLLSGGEKAMTAVALIFAIFQLNPSPFCMLDEVDAPLDDANVGRFCTMVEEMSNQVQFIFITHNKVTMELATHLSGVTMHEPGVSRMVTVDIEEAMSLAENT